MHGKRWRMCYKVIRRLYGYNYIKTFFRLNEYNPNFMLIPF